MRKIWWLTAVITMLFVLAACSGEAGTSVTQQPSETPVAAEETPAETPESDEPAYYGTWTVQEAVGFAQVSTGADESMIGKKAAYSTEKASFDEEEAVNPVYEEAKVTSGQFAADYRIQLSALGIDGESLSIVTIKDWTAPGSLLLIKDDQTLITLWDGTFYALKKDS